MSETIITVSKPIDAGSKKSPIKANPDRVLTWPEGKLKIESFANVEGVTNPFAIKQADEHTLQHDVSTFWRNNGGNLKKLPDAPTAGRKLWFDGEVVRLNHNFEPGEKGSDRISIAVENAIKTAELLTKADKSNPVTAEQQLRNSGLTRKDLESALAKLKEIEKEG